MSLDEFDGSDMELDSDASSHSETAYQCSKLSNSSNTHEKKDKLDNGKKIFSSLHSLQSENGSLQSSNARSNHMSELGTKSHINMYHAPPRPSPPFNSQGIISPKQTSPITSSKVPLTLNTISLKQPNSFFLKSPMNKSPTKNNVSNEPTPLEKHDKIRFELKSSGFKNRLLSPIDKQSANTSAKHIFNVNNNVNKNVHGTNLDKESSIFVNKSLSSSVKVSHNEPEKVEPNCNDGDKRIIHDKFKQPVEDHVTKETEISLDVKDLNQQIDNNSSELIRENSVVVEKNQLDDQLVSNNSTGENSEKDNEVIDDMDIDEDQVDELVENSVILKKGQNQEENQIDDGDSRVQRTDLEIIQEVLHNTEVQPKSIDVVDEPLDSLTGDSAIVDTINKIDDEIQDFDNDDNKSPINTEEDESDLSMSEQDHGSEIASSEEGESEKEEDDEPEIINVQVTPKSKDKGKKVALPVKQTSTVDTDQINKQTNSPESSRPTIQSNSESTSHSIQPIKVIEEKIEISDLPSDTIKNYREFDAKLVAFDEAARMACNAYVKLRRSLPEGTVIRIDPPADKWRMITCMLGLIETDFLLLPPQDTNESKDNNNLDEEKLSVKNEEETSSEAESDDEGMDVPSDDPNDKNYKFKSTISKQQSPKRWHNTRSNRPPSANLRQRSRRSQRTKVNKVEPDPPITPTTSSSKKRQSRSSSKRTLRTRKKEDEEDKTTTSSSVKSTTSGSQKKGLVRCDEDGKPRRPANGFSYFCGDICSKVKSEKLPISGTIAYAAEIWKKMSNEEKRPWLVRGEKSKNEYQDLLCRWKEKQELKTSGIKRAAPPKTQNVFSYKKPRKDE